MTQRKARNYVKKPFFQLDLFSVTQNQTFTFIDIINPKIWADYVSVIPFLV